MEFSHSREKACPLFLLGKKKNHLPFCPLLEDLNKRKIHSTFSAFLFFPAMKSYLTVTSQCVALGSLVMYEGEDLSWVNRAHTGSGGQTSAALPLSSPLLQALRKQQRPTWEELLFPRIFFFFKTLGLSLLLVCYQPMKLIF